MSKILSIAVAAVVLAGVAGQAAAQDRRFEQERGHDERGHDDRGHDERGRDHDMRRFEDRDFDRWHTGHWVEARRDGRLGWWWVVGPSWYYYAQPVYPYPDPYQPPAVAGPPPQTFWWCERPRGYYPYVPACAVPWRAVPAG